MTRKFVKRMAGAAVACLLLAGLLAACGSQNNQGEGETRVLRIATMYGDGGYNEHLRTQYTDVYDFTHPNVEIEFVTAFDYSQFRYQDIEEAEMPDPVEEMKKIMQGPNPPDVVMMSYPDLYELVNENLLSPLEPYMTEDDFDTEGFVPSVIEALKSAGNGKLYALSPSFYSTALIYNRALFDEAGVEYPRDGMTWQEVFDLARRVSRGEGAERVYGFSFSQHVYSDLFYDLQNYTAPIQLQMMNEEGKELLVDSEQWVDVWETFAQLYKDDVIPQSRELREHRSENPHPFEDDVFLSERVAMTLIGYNSISEIINVNANADQYEGFDPIDWDVVTMPTHPEAPEIGASMSMDPILGINAKAQNTEDAWDFIKFINGDEWAELKSRSSSMLLSRKDYNEPQNGLNYNMEAFFALKPPPANNEMDFFRNPRIWEIQSLGEMKFQQVLEDEKTIEEALKEWKTEGDAILQQMEDSGASDGASSGGTVIID